MLKHSDNSELDTYFRDVRRFSPLKREEENELGRRYREGDAAAGHRLVTANLRFVVKIAGEYRSSGLPEYPKGSDGASKKMLESSARVRDHQVFEPPRKDLGVRSL